MRFYLTAVSILSLVLSNPIRADIDSRLESWNLFFVNAPITGPWGFYFEVQPRFTLTGQENHRLLVRPAIRYRLPSGLTLWAGHAWTPTFEPTYRNENRFWQQAQYEVRNEKWVLNLRSRLEERLISNTREPGKLSLRYRQWVRVLKQTPWEKVRFAVTDEVFFNLNTVLGGPVSGFDQNRLFLGTLFELSSSLSIEGGYMNNYVNDVQRDRINHVIYSFFMLNL